MKYLKEITHERFDLSWKRDDTEREDICNRYANIVWRHTDPNKIKLILMAMCDIVYSHGLRDMDRMHAETEKAA